MKALKAYWKPLLGLLLILAAVLLVVRIYLPAHSEYRARREQLENSISAWQTIDAEGRRYIPVQDYIPAAEDAISESRRTLYGNFPAKIKEEDQIMYILYLEELFGTELQFGFGTEEELAVLSDGAVLSVLTITLECECGYEDFRRAVSQISRDGYIASVDSADMEYEPESGLIKGTVTLRRYLLSAGQSEYRPLEVNVPETGRENIFG